MPSITASNQKQSYLQSWPGCSHVAIFVSCLHHLDFDLLEDWPSVTEQLFTAKTAQQTLQQRVKAVEWALYRLFERYDAVGTKDKLRPFFPPTTQLQSLNLRAALYRCLNELKKDGILGKDVVLRKTMLDDCKGERLEEALSSFALAVLLKTGKISTTAAGVSLPESQLVPIALAYHASLRRNLETRRLESVKAEHTLRDIALSEEKLLHRLERSTMIQTELDKEKQQQLRSLVDSNWIGNHAWSDTLFYGVPGELIVTKAKSVDTNFLPKESLKLIDDLDGRIERHRSRLAEWQFIAKESARRQTRVSAGALMNKMPVVEKSSASAQFSRHKELCLTDWKSGSGTQPSMTESYNKLREAMQDELDAVSSRTATKSSVENRNVHHETSVAMASSPVPSNLQRNGTAQSVEHDSPTMHPLSVPTLVPYPEPLLSPQTQNHNSLLDSPHLFSSEDADSSWISNHNGAIPHPNVHTESYVPRPSPPLPAVNEPPVSPSKMWMSLADRTKASMSTSGRQSILTDPEPDSSTILEPESAAVSSLSSTAATETPNFHLSSDEDRRSTLLERTRKSMSMFTSSSAPRPRKPKRSKPRTLSSAPEEDDDGGNGRFGTTTPRNQLFSEDADYDSVFKSRPKLATSPALGPRRSISPFVKENGVGDLEDEGVSSLDDSRWI